jgi:hypothetical protein
MKTLPMHRDEKKSDATIECSTGILSVYRYCAYCKHCRGIRMGSRVYPAPQEQVLNNIRRGAADDEGLMNAALQFNLLVRDGDAVECDDDAGTGYQSRYR